METIFIEDPKENYFVDILTKKFEDEFLVENQLRIIHMLEQKFCDVNYTDEKGIAQSLVGVSTEFVKEHFNDNVYDLLFILKTKNDNKFVDRAFALCLYDENGIYIDVICSKGYGTKLLSFILKYSLNNKFNVSLSSMPWVLAYYWKFGFRFAKSCNDIDESEINAELMNNVLQEAKEKKSETTYKAFKKTIYTKHLLQLLTNLHLSNGSKFCKEKVKGVEDAYRKNCWINGYSMIKCDFTKENINSVLIKNKEFLKSSSKEKKTKLRTKRLTESEKLQEEAKEFISRKRSRSDDENHPPYELRKKQK